MNNTGDAVKVTQFDFLFKKLEEPTNADVAKASAEIASLSESIQALAEATAELAKPRFTTYFSA